MRWLVVLVAALAAIVVVVLSSSASHEGPHGEIAFASYAEAAESGFYDDEQATVALWRNGKTVALLAPEAWETYGAPVWSPNGETTAAPYSTNAQFGSPPQVALVDSTGAGDVPSFGRPRWLDAQASGPGASAVSPDGRWEAYVDGAAISVRRRGSWGQGFVVARCPARCAYPAWRPR